MRSLFFKLFIWLWVAMLLINLTLIAVTVVTRSEPFLPRRHGIVPEAMRRYAHSAATVYEHGGPAALKAYLHQIENDANIRSFLFDAAGREATQRNAPRGVRRLVGDAAKTDEPQFRPRGRIMLMAQRVVSPKGAAFVFVGIQQRELFNMFNVNPIVRLLRVAAVLMTGSLVCFWLARYITSPIVKLRTATQQLASGDLKARVGPAMGRRRDELADLGHDFDRMAERIETLMLSQNRLLGDISHELRSPLARLNVALALARRQAGEAAAGSLDRIEREAQRLNDLIGQLLTLTRLESGEAPPQRTPIDLAQLVGEIAADAEFEARSHNRHVEVIGAVPCSLDGSPELLRSAIENVVRNAVHYTAEGTIVSIELKKEIEPGQAMLTVSDQGPGVPEDSLGELFRPFYRVADARDRQSGGIGLGLTITQRAVLSYGGSVRAVNRPQGGLCVEIRLPLRMESANLDRQPEPAR